MNSQYSFDPLCLELAGHFLPDDSPDDAKNELAQAIQNAVEDHILNQSTPGGLDRATNLCQRQI